MSDTLGFGIVGAGVIFRSHATALKSLGAKARLVGIAELDDKRRAEATDKFFAPVACADYHELLARDDIDVLTVCTPPAFHADVVIDALAAGKYVVCEKPLAHTLAEADRIIDAAENYPGRLSTVYQLRYTPETQKIKWLIENGHLGKLVFGHCVRFASLSDGPRSRWWGAWGTAGGGVAMTQFIHHLDQLIHFFGPVAEVESILITGKEPIESEDSFAANILFESGALVAAAATVAGQRYEYKFDIVGETMSVHSPCKLVCADKGRLREVERALAGQFGGGRKSRAQGPVGKLWQRVGRKLGLVKPGPTAHKHYLNDVVRSIREGLPLPIGADQARQSLELCVAIYTAGITGQRVRLPLQAGCQFYDGITPDDYQHARAATLTQ